MPKTQNARKDVLAKVCGKAKYTGDIKLKDMVYATAVHSTLPCAQILAIDTTAAKNAPGVLAVFTAKDIPHLASQPQERPVLCKDIVRCVGDGIALVVAQSRAQAKNAAALVKATYKELPCVLTPQKALEENAPQVHEVGNTICQYVTVRGKAEDALKTAPHTLTQSYTTQRVQHVCLETEAAIANYKEETGQVTVYCPVNSPFVIRKVVADCLGFPLTDVVIKLAAIGGSFGGKNYDIAMAASRAALASFLLKKPCKIVLSREESIAEGTKRHPLSAKYTVGFNGQGLLLAAKIELLLDGGAYKSKTFPVTSRMAIEASGPYYIPNINTTSTSVYTNNVYSDALRGFGSPQVDFCSESIMDEIAHFLNKSPLEVRRLNMLREGGLSSTGQSMQNVSLAKCASAMEKAANLAQRQKDAAQYNKTHSQTKRGVGVAFLHRGESFGAAGQGVDSSCGMVSVQQDGSITVASSISDVGQGACAMLANLVHKALGVPHKNIHVPQVNTAYLTDAGPTVATRGTVFCGGAVLNAAQQIKEKLSIYAKKRLGTANVVFNAGRVTDAKNKDNYLPFSSLVQDVFAAGEHLNAIGHFAAPPLEYCKKTGVGSAYAAYVYGAVAADVTVDLGTGAVQVNHLFCVHDVGLALDKKEVEGQILGGASMGVGFALYEEVEMENGRVKNQNFENYIIPTALDMPQVYCGILEEPGTFGPFGAKGLGEPATCAVAPAIVNAIYNASLRRVRHLPASLEQVLLGKSLKKG